MVSRFFALLVVLVALVSFQPGWIQPDWSDPLTWAAESPPEEASAALLRLAAIALATLQLVGLGLVGLGTIVGNGTLVRLGRRLVVPALRTMIPLAVAAGPSVPALASVDPGTVPPAVTAAFEQPQPSASIVVEPGDSMWTIAEANAPGPVGTYWARMVDLNRQRFEDVDLIHPGDVVLLPSGEDADPHSTPWVVDVGVDQDDRLPGSESEDPVDDGHDDGWSDPGRENVIPPVSGRPVPMLPPIFGG